MQQDFADTLWGWLALRTMPRCGFATVVKLLEIFHTPTALFAASAATLRQAGAAEALIEYLKNPNRAQIEACLAWQQQRPERNILHWQDTRYPPLLREIASPPLLLFVEGNASLLQHPQIAIVGARGATATGAETAYSFSQELAGQGWVITSGLARGIDAAGHRGSLSKTEKTIAVLGSGLDHIYPSCHRYLTQQILAKGGALVSEFLPNASPKAAHFPQRNRIISGLSLGVIVIEAAEHSGSLITARYAAEQGREVFAIPGSVRSPLSKGCHALIKEGAILVEDVQDVLSVLSSSPLLAASPLAVTVNPPTQRQHEQDHFPKPSHELDSEDTKLVECLGFETTTIDCLVMRTGLSASKLLPRLSVLELQGHICAVPGGYLRK